jgi:hypothetical protein
VLDAVPNEAGPSTAEEYARRYAAARRLAANLDAKTRLKLAALYVDAADDAAEVVRSALDRGLSKLTTERWSLIAGQLYAAADEVALGVESYTKDLVGKAASIYPEIDAGYVLKAARSAGASQITKTGLSAMVAGVNSRVVESLVSRVYADGQNFSSRVWGGAGVRADWLERIRYTVSAGIAQGRDPVKIAKDIQAYARGGKIELIQRWGDLERGTEEFAKRLPGRIDWRATRLVRSELYASLQDSQVRAGELNPGCDGWYDWVLTPGRQHWECDCEELAAGGPYKAEEVPTYPHPQCLCVIRPHLRERASFVADLRRWAGGGDVGYLDTWYTKYREAT